MRWQPWVGRGVALGAILLAGCGTWGFEDRERVTARPAGEAPAGGYAAGMLPGNVPAGSKDALFLAEAAHGSASELETSRIALQRAKNQQVKDFAQTMLTDHRTASQQLIDLANREGHPLPSVPAEGVEQKTLTMQRVSANEFDRTYMEQMVEDHIRTLNMFRDVAKTSSDPEVRAFAAAQVPTLEAHLRQAESLRDTLNKTAQR
ncbi:MAG: DUF4142 domain-containing protein [Candidatus Methylomirabilales bacterium]